jgi:hypothetical protein
VAAGWGPEGPPRHLLLLLPLVLLLLLLLLLVVVVSLAGARLQLTLPPQGMLALPPLPLLLLPPTLLAPLEVVPPLPVLLLRREGRLCWGWQGLLLRCCPHCRRCRCRWMGC